MSNKKRTSVEDALDSIFQNLDVNTPSTAGALSTDTNLSWVVIDRAIELAMKIQTYLRVNKIVVLGGRGRKIVLIEPRVDLMRIPQKTREWFIEEMFFKGEEKKHYSTEEARQILGTYSEHKMRTKLENAINCIIECLELEDELSVLEISKRTDLNRRTVERVLDIFTRFQDNFAKAEFTKIDGAIILRNHPDLYSFDETRMIYLLKKLFLPHLAEKLSEDKERSLLQIV